MAMSRQERAKQFAPFDAMRGLREALKKKELEHERCERKELSEESMQELSEILSCAQAGDTAEVTFFHEGRYVCVRGRLKKIDGLHRTLYLEEGKIQFHDVFKVKILS